MKKFTRFAALFMAASMLFGATVFADDEVQTAETVETEAAPESPFKDVSADTETGKAILKLYNAGVVAGYEDDTFRPEGSITRAELVRIFNQVFKYKPSDAVMAEVENFTDNTDPEAWYYNDVRIAQVAGYINGFEDNTFRGKENFTRQQACVVIDLITGVNTLDPELEITDEVSEWAENYVNWAVTAGLFELEDGNTFRATQNITRAEVCNLLEIFVSDATDETPEETTALAEDETQEVTVKTSNGTVVKVTTGGSGGGSSRRSTSTTSAAESSTESTTAAAVSTDAATESTTAAASSGGSSKSSETTNAPAESSTDAVTEASTEATTEAQTVTSADVAKPDASVISSLNAVYKALNNHVIPNCSTDAQRDVAKQISSALMSYLRDYSFDISSAANSAIDSYHQLSSEEKRVLRNLILQYVNVSDLLTLQETYFPGLL